MRVFCVLLNVGVSILLILLILLGDSCAFSPRSPVSDGDILRRHRRPSVTTCVSATASSASSKAILEGTGLPSNVGWQSDRLNRLTEWVEKQKSNRPIVCEYNPKGLWLWRRWKGTVLKATWGSVLLAMLTGLVVDYFARGRCLANYKLSWSLLAVPSQTDPLIRRLTGVKKLWEYQLSLATFILTFFLSHSFGYWQKVYNCTRCIQGRINDFCMLLVMGAERGVDEGVNKAPPARSNVSTNPKGSRGFSDKSGELVELCTRLVRLSHTLFWAQTATSSNGLSDSEEYLKDIENCNVPIDDEHIGPLLLSPYGLKALVNTGQLTKEERESLMGTGLPPSQNCFVLLTWAGIHLMDGLKKGLLRGGAGYEENLFRNLAACRASMFDIDDFRAGRMPLAYVQMVQVLVDSLVMIAPFALYPETGLLSVPLAGLLALFFRGLLALSKSFLDPFGVEGFKEQNIRVDVLVSELNFGAARRWISAGGFLPPKTSSENNGTYM